jgi:hypothetical protein
LFVYAGITKLFSSDSSLIEVAGSVPKPATQFIPSPTDAIKTKQRARRAGKVEKARSSVRQDARKKESELRTSETKQRYQTKAEYEASKVQAKAQGASQTYQTKADYEASKAAAQASAAKAKSAASVRLQKSYLENTNAKAELERQRKLTVNARARLADKRTASATKSKLSKATTVAKDVSKAIPK